MDGQQGRRIVIVTPVLNDWPSLKTLIANIGKLEALVGSTIGIVAVDDGSIEIDAPGPDLLRGPIKSIEVLKLNANVGHQRAIALGLAYAQKSDDFDFAIVMDSDGEDRPEDLERLLATHKEHPGAIIVARRAQRSEGLLFRAFYQIYKLVFRQLTGKAITFGNFSLVPRARLGNVLFNSGVWNNFAATMLRSRVPIEFVDTCRGTRYFGSSHMNFTMLMLHGMSAISVFSDVVIGRIILGLVFLAGVFFLGVGLTIYLKYGTQVLVPGYATTVILILLSILINALTIGFLSILALLAGRSQVTVHPTTLLDAMLAKVITVSQVRAAVSLG